ncbi:BMP family ABC transporter substrate-binding protein [Acidaminobacter sp. JC074]|uniref:BMP family ABC transporter substrate-binding protein n=1 Tax=Acidaminobacter sp. JC074 TaxID=2530199 RepID=UPI001F10D366|nr:BMP family ABC transporter substrate-binding protein [Acidaminobacter sp. JC074]MCH4890961.1 BMP family ABC transporter substrate-binding protein [Acidaminobacter sp. JC074]
MFDNLIETYNDARGKARREYNRRKARGMSGHLTSLEGIIKDIDIISTIDIGEMEIPLKKIKGTNSSFRRMSFSKNFLPLEESRSEFASKWMALCESHLEEGIRDPIKVYEYMNYFYVIEGNKRVSVLSYFEADAIQARILRLIPRYDENNEDVKLYYRFLDFNKLTGLNQIWLTDRNDYAELEEALEKYTPDSDFYETKYKAFYHEVYLPFRKVFKEAGGDKLAYTTGDALILYNRIYDLPKSLSVAETKLMMPSLISELMNFNLDESREIKTSSSELNANLLESISTIIGPKKRKIAFIYAKNIEESGWSYSHEHGRIAIQEKFGSAIETKSFENVRDDEALKELIDHLVLEGYHAVFTTAMIHRKATLSAALKYNKVHFFNCSGSRPYVHMSSYYGRSYETRFLTGMIAGAMTKTNILGYTASVKTPDTISCINAFALGAKMVNPNAIVKVSFTGVWNSPEDNEKKIKLLATEGADLITSKNNILSREATKSYGITSMLCSVDSESKALSAYLAAPIWKWEVFYTKIIQALMNGSYDRIIKGRSKQVINFWWGIESGGIDIYMNDLVPSETRKLVNIMRHMIISDQFNPFSGPIKDQMGEVRVEDREVLSAEAIIEMDWYVSNVKILDLEI